MRAVLRRARATQANPAGAAAPRAVDDLGYLMSRLVNHRFEALARTTTRLAGGDLSARTE